MVKSGNALTDEMMWGQCKSNAHAEAYNAAMDCTVNMGFARQGAGHTGSDLYKALH